MFILKSVPKNLLSHHHQNGFTLLEVIISVSIIALIFLSLFRMQSGTIRLAAVGRFNSLAPVLAKQLLVRIEQDINNFSEVKGDFGENYPGITWMCSIMDASFGNLDYISEKNQDRFKRIDLRITGQSGSRSYEISTWRVIDE